MHVESAPTPAGVSPAAPPAARRPRRRRRRRRARAARLTLPARARGGARTRAFSRVRHRAIRVRGAAAPSASAQRRGGACAARPPRRRGAAAPPTSSAAGERDRMRVTSSRPWVIYPRRRDRKISAKLHIQPRLLWVIGSEEGCNERISMRLRFPEGYGAEKDVVALGPALTAPPPLHPPGRSRGPGTYLVCFLVTFRWDCTFPRRSIIGWAASRARRAAPAVLRGHGGEPRVGRPSFPRQTEMTIRTTEV